jgi:hypothetical protein
MQCGVAERQLLLHAGQVSGGGGARRLVVVGVIERRVALVAHLFDRLLGLGRIRRHNLSQRIALFHSLYTYIHTASILAIYRQQQQQQQAAHQRGASFGARQLLIERGRPRFGRHHSSATTAATGIGGIGIRRGGGGAREPLGVESARDE